MHALLWAEQHCLVTAASDGVLRWWDPRASRPLAGQVDTGSPLTLTLTPTLLLTPTVTLTPTLILA